MASNPSSGFKVGDTVLCLKPLVIIAKRCDFGHRCDSCMEWGMALQRCSACQQVFYCNRSCQKKEWSSHKLECATLKEFGPIAQSLESGTVLQGIGFNTSVLEVQFFTSGMGRLLLKLACLFMKNRKLRLQDFSDDAQLKTLQDLPLQRSHLENNPFIMMQFRSFFTKLSQMVEKSKMLSRSLLFDLFCIVNIHHIPVPCVSSSPGAGFHTLGNLTAAGLFPSLSAFSFSCKPNSYFFMLNGRLSVKAVCDIPAKCTTDFSMVTVMFDAALRHVDLRSDILRKKYYLDTDCSCERCKEDREAPFLIRCSVSGCLGFCYLDKEFSSCSSCDKCGSPPHHKALDKEYVLEYKKKLMAHYDTPNLNVPRVMSETLSEERNPFHCLDIINLNLYNILSGHLSISDTVELRRIAAKIIRDIVIPGYHRYAPWHAMSIALHHMRLARCSDDQSERERSLFAAVDSFEVLFGEDLTKKILSA